MFTEVSFRERLLIVPVIVSAFLVAAFWAGTGGEDNRSSKDACRTISHSGVKNNSLPRTAAILTRTCEGSKSEDAGGSGKVVSSDLQPSLTMRGFSFKTRQWPQQSAGAHRSPQRPGDVGSTVDGLVDDGLVTGFFIFGATAATHKCIIPEINEARSTMQSEQFGYRFQGHSPTSQGCVVVNF